jgi:hypothetical protein
MLVIHKLRRETSRGKLAAVSFPSTGGAGVLTSTLGVLLLRGFYDPFANLAAQLLNRNRKARKDSAQSAKNAALLAAAARLMPKGSGGRKLRHIIYAPGVLAHQRA